MDLVSVIVTNYNYQQYIEEAIRSVLNQTYQNFELIIVDDGSTDQSASIIGKYESLYPEKIKAVYKENGGQGSSFNIGFEQSTGDILAFLDADDYWYPKKLENIVRLHEKYNGVQHNILINGEKPFTILEDNTVKQRAAMLNFGFLGVVPTSALSFKKHSLNNVFPIPEQEYRICADLYLRNIYLVNDDIYSSDESLAFYRVHGSNNWYHSSKDFSSLIKKTVELINLKIKPREIPYEPNGISFTTYFWSTLYFKRDANYIIYGTGLMGKRFMQNIIESNGNVVGFTSSIINRESYCGLPVYNISQLENNEVDYDYILIASEQMGSIYEFVKSSTKIPNGKLIYPQL